MLMVKYKPILVALLLLSLAAKALAFAHVSCPQPQQSGVMAGLLDTGMMDHHQHADMSAPSVADSTVDCCADCDCPSGNCGSALLTLAVPLSAIHRSSPPGDFTRLVVSRMAHFLFRPPIAA
jgi:hypothetical protein